MARVTGTLAVLVTVTLLQLAQFCAPVSAMSAMHERVQRMMMKATQPELLVADAAQWYTQTLDHFNAQDTRTFQQRFWVNSTFWNNNGPVLIYIGGEAALSDRVVLSGEFVELGQRYGALLVALEHRFYGLSLPFAELTTDNLRYLSSEQALEDLAQFLGDFLRMNHAQGNLVLCVGGSYPGSLSAWFRYKYPNRVVGSLASSAPVLAWPDYYMYDQVVAASAGPACAAAVRQATRQVVALLNDPQRRAAVKAQFGGAAVADDVAFLYVLADTAAWAIQYGHREQLCNAMEGAADVLAAYAQFVQGVFATTGMTATQWDISSYTNTSAGEDDNMRQWMYQSCTEFGYFQTAPAVDSLRAPNITLQWHLNVCQKLFGAALVPNAEAVNRRYGGNETDGSNIFFVNGSQDPWHVLSVQRNLSDTLPAIVISGTAHCTDLHASAPTDSAALRAARAAIAQRVGQWLRLLPTCPNDCSGHGQCSAASVCVCDAGYYGADCGFYAPTLDMQGAMVAAVFAGAAVIGLAAGLTAVLLSRRLCPLWCRSAAYQSVGA